MHCVYFVQCPNSGAIKIGTSKSLSSRLYALSRNFPNGMLLLGALEVYPNTRKDAFAQEAEWHRRFDEDCIDGEWFVATRALRDAITASRDMHLPYINDLVRRYSLTW